MRFPRRARCAPTFRILFALWTALVVAASVPAHAQRSPYFNIINERFATVSNGPQNTLIVDVPDNADPDQIRQATLRRARGVLTAQARTLAPQLTAMERAGLIRPGAVFPVGQIVTLRQNGRPVTPTRKPGRAVPGDGTLTFRYTGFNETDRELLTGFIALALPRIEAIYGKPAVSGEVEIVNAGNLINTTIPETRRFAYGIYNPSTNQIFLPLFVDPRGSLQALLLNLVFAFHGPAVLQYDAWEQGMARAVAALVLRNPEFNTNYGMDDPSANSLYSLMRFYDLLNQPPLGNNTFFPPSQTNIPIDGQITVAKMLWARIGMSGAAWLKVFIENPSFFRDFNAAYYAQVTPGAQPSLAGNVPALKQIAASLLPNGVEGIPFNDWYARQYVLDTSVSPGVKLYAFVIPAGFDENQRQQHSVTLVYYRTERTGDENVLAGRAYGLYTDASNKTVSFGAASEQAPITEGEGGLTVVTTNTQGSDAQRLTMDFTVGDAVARTYLPVGFNGDVQGVLLAPNGATKVSVRQDSELGVPVRERNDQTVEGAAFGVPLGVTPGDLGRLTFSVTDGTNTRTWKVNVAGDAYYAILRDGSTGGGVITVAKTFPSHPVAYLVSFPVQPLSTNIAEALSLPGTDFLLSAWNPLQASYETFQPDTPSVAPIRTGRGYWLKVSPQDGAAERTVTVTGTPPPSDTDLAVPCSFGWNLIGSPFSTTIDVTTVQVKYLQNDPISWEQAVEQNLVAALPFTLNRQNGQYGTVNAFVGGEWQGYWLRVLVPSGITLILPGPNAPTRAARSRAAVPYRSARPDWQIRISARADLNGRTSVGEAYLGAAPGASRAFDNRFDREEPPAIVPQVGISFVNREFKAAGGRFVRDFRGTEEATTATWDVQVVSPADGPVTLTWDGWNGGARRRQLTLIDTTTGERIGLRSRSGFTFPAKAGVTRSFQIVAERGESLPLQILNVMTLPSRATGGGISLSYTLSRAADVRAELTTISGKVMARQSLGRAAAGGAQRFVLNARSQNGASLPPGPYLLSLTARDENGNQAQSRRVVTLLQ
ncbi:MAG: hypothetical protein SFU56_21725 [Capsulimonadales bacterium]|nr:hypothetical protein [Capsulimonadales bacterium]